MAMNKSEKNLFLANGGILIRKGVDRYNKPIIKARTKDKDWHPHLKYTSIKQRDAVYDYMLKQEKEKYKED